MNENLEETIEESIEVPLPPVNVAELEATEAGQRTAMICRSAAALKALDISVLDVRGQTIIADYFVICTGTSSTHIESIAGHVQDTLRSSGMRARPEGNSVSAWIVMDYGDAILHVLSEETREFYDLERLWADSLIAQWPDEAAQS